MLRKRFEFYQLLLDILIGGLSLQLSFLIRSVVPLGMTATPESLAIPRGLSLIILVVWMFIFYQNDIYVRKFGTMFRMHILNLVKSHFIATLLYFGVLYLTFRDVSRLQSMYFVVIFLTGMVATRIILHALEVRALKQNERKFHVVIIGTGINALQLRDKIYANPRNNLHLLGFFRLHKNEEIYAGLESAVLGDAKQIVEYVSTHRVDEVIIATNRYSEELAKEISQIMYSLHPYSVAIRLAPDYSEISFFHVVTEDFEGLPLIGLRTPIFSPTQRLVKRGIDLTIALAIGIIGLPVFAAIALAIRLDSKGPIILRQQRVGIHGQPFSMYKFRSMYDKINQNRFDETKIDIIKRPNDSRVTRVGRFLRRTSLDELPQFFNVIKGDMSLVGPRPELPDRVQDYSWWQYKRFEVPQGMTGWWQINGRANRPMHLHTEDDLYYIQNYSILLDLRILWHTIRVVFTGEGAF